MRSYGYNTGFDRVLEQSALNPKENQWIERDRTGQFVEEVCSWYFFFSFFFYMPFFFGMKRETVSDFSNDDHDQKIKY